MISAESIQKYIHNKELTVKVFGQIDSTNAEARRYAAAAESFSPVLFVAEEQSAGRGRLGRSFLSRAACGIYMSLLYFTDHGLADAVNVTTAAAVAVAAAIESVTGNPMKIKWVNDVYNESGKVCGILAETLPVEGRIAIIVGVGINTGDISFPEELQGIASTVGDLHGEDARLIAEVTNGLMSYAADPSDRSYMQGYRARFMLTDAYVDLLRAGERIACGRVLGVDEDGGLLFLPDGEDAPQTVRSGEVSVRKKQS
ncbi:MAG: biotin--[Clostridia bacterium]|nr:biotin--[acetyl-CoA-carboxylase] ligase [Clostridia bacterium]